VTALPEMDNNCTTTSLIPTVNGNTVRSFSKHGQQSAAQGSSTTVSRSDIRLIQHLYSAHGLVRRWRLIGYFPIHLLPPAQHACQCWVGCSQCSNERVLRGGGAGTYDADEAFPVAGLRHARLKGGGEPTTQRVSLPAGWLDAWDSDAVPEDDGADVACEG
jgi:hypothetical protein